MTKYGKTKKLMKETGISKKEAQDYLRKAGWDYETAKQLWKIKKIADGIAQAFQKLTENLQKATQKMAESIRKISEASAAAAGISEDEEKDFHFGRMVGEMQKTLEIELTKEVEQERGESE